LKLPPVVFDVCVAEIVAVPAVSPVTVSVGLSPHDVKVTLDGLTVATPGGLDEIGSLTRFSGHGWCGDHAAVSVAV
jgi:hypothetical protein